MAWAKGSDGQIRWEGQKPTLLYHFTGERSAREILRDRELRPNARILYSLADEDKPKGFLSFTDDREWFGKEANGKPGDDRGLPIRFTFFRVDIPGVRPVVYTTDPEAEPYSGTVDPAGDLVLSDAIAHEREWVTRSNVLLLEGRFEVDHQ